MTTPFPLLTRTLLLLASLTVAHAADRTIDGTGNSTSDRGSTHTPFIRIASADYGDGLSTLAGAARPSARVVSNLISDQNVSEPNGRGGSDFIWQWGQFLDHDITHSPADSGEDASILITDLSDVLHPVIPMTRTEYITDGSSIRQQVNAITSFIDASNVYGSDSTTANALRTFSGGLLKTEADGMLPFNTAGLDMAGVGVVPGVTATDLRMAGDVRANEQSGLTAMHLLFVQEHNRLANEISTANPGWTDEQIYQRARKIVGALMQSITYNEWLPALLGPAAPDPTTFSYNAATDPSISNEFATALFRFGHTMVSPQIMRIHDNDFPDPTPSKSLMDSFFNPSSIASIADYEYILKGLACQLHQETDARIVNELRHTLFGPPGSGGMDLAALNIQRGRDHGLPDYNSARTAYGLPTITTWSQLSSDTFVQTDFNAMYSDIDDVDLWPAALSEDHLPGAGVGELLATSLAEEFTRLAEGDAFFYLWDTDLSPTLRGEITFTSLSHIIGRNTSLSLQENVFFVKQPELEFNSVTYNNATGTTMTFHAKANHEYQIKYGSSPDSLTSDLLGSPVSSGMASYMLTCVDIDAKNHGERYYQLVESPLTP